MSSYAQTIKNYTINATSKTITFTDYTTILLERIALITDVTTGSILYQFNSSSVTGTASGNVLTLSAMAGVSNTDKLRIDYTNAAGDPTYETPALPGGASTAANQTNGAQQTRLTNGTTVVDVLAGDAGQNAMPVAGARSEQAFTTTTAITTTPKDVSSFASVSVQISGQGTGSSITFQGSNDNSTWLAVPLHSVALVSSGGGLGNEYNNTNAAGIFYGALPFRYFRLNIIGISAGTTSGTIEYFAEPTQLHLPTVVAVQNGTWSATPQPLATSTGLTSFFSANLLATATSVKASSGRWHNYNVYNANTSGVFLQIFDLATGSVTLGTTTPKQSVYIPPSAVWDGMWIHSLSFATALTIAATTTATGSTPPTTGLVVNLGVI